MKPDASPVNTVNPLRGLIVRQLCLAIAFCLGLQSVAQPVMVNGTPQGGAPATPNTILGQPGLPPSQALQNAVANAGGVPPGVCLKGMNSTLKGIGFQGLADHDTIMIDEELAKDPWQLGLVLEHEKSHSARAQAAGTETDESTEDSVTGDCAHSEVHCDAVAEMCARGQTMAEVHPTFESFLPCEKRDQWCDRIGDYNAACDAKAGAGSSTPCGACDPADCPCFSY